MAKSKISKTVTIEDIDKDQDWLVSDFEKLLVSFRKLGIQQGKPGANPHKFACELALRDLEMLHGIILLAPTGDDEAAARWHLKVYRAMQKGHTKWMKHLSLPELLRPGNQGKKQNK